MNWTLHRSMSNVLHKAGIHQVAEKWTTVRAYRGATPEQVRFDMNRDQLVIYTLGGIPSYMRLPRYVKHVHKEVTKLLGRKAKIKILRKI